MKRHATESKELAKGLADLKAKIATAEQNARQGEMGFPFAIGKVPPIRDMAHSVAQTLVKQLKEANAMSEDF